MRRLELLALLFVTTAVHAQDERWTGKTVITIRSDVVMIPKNGKQPDTGVLLNDTLSYRVLAEEAGQVKVVTTTGATGWINKADTVPIERAVAYFGNAIMNRPHDAPSYQKRAHAWELRGDYELALKDINELVNLRPAEAAAWVSRGSIYCSLRRYDQAIIDFNVALRFDRTLVAAYYNRAEAWIGKKAYQKAIDDLDTALDLDPKLAAAYSSRGLAHFLSQEYDRAIADFDRSQRLDPSNGWLHKNRAWMLATCKVPARRDGPRAVALAEKALRQEPHATSEFLETLAAAHAENGKFEEAVRHQRKALEDPLLENDQAANHRLELYRHQKAYRQP